MPATAPPRPAPLRHELAGLLAGVRSRLRRYVLVRGVALTLCVAVGIFWAALWLDDAYFFLARLELPAWVRVLFDALAVASLLAAAGYWLVGRLIARLRPRDLALAAERRFPDLRGRLVLAVERAIDPAGHAAESRFTAALADRAAADAAARVSALPPGELFDPVPLRRAVALAAALLVGTGAFALWQTDAVRRLTDAYIELAEVYRVRTTALRVAAVLPPGEDIKDLVPGETHRHPRGADLTLNITVPTGEKPGGGPWRAPDRVTVTRETAGGATGRSFALPDGPGRFRFALDEVRDGMTLTFAGGDYVDRVPYVIEAVDPPRPRRVLLSAVYPDYTGLNRAAPDGSPAADRRPVRGAKASVPVGTTFDLILEANKPLADARVTVDGEAVPSVMRTEDGAASVAVPLAMLAPPPADGDEDAKAVPVPENAVGVRPDARVTAELVDGDGIRSQSPVRLVLAGILDSPPDVRAEPVGVSDALTRTASVPFVGFVEDDYGVAGVRFRFRLSGGDPPGEPTGDDDAANGGDKTPAEELPADGWRTRKFRRSPRGLPERFAVGEAGDESSVMPDAERFELAALDAKTGQLLTLTVVAEDGNTLTGPGVTVGPERTFEIVTEAELLARLFDREVNLRRVFERSLEEVVAAGDELALLTDSSTAAEVRQAAAGAAGELGQNAGQAAVVEEDFRAILAELVNNGVQTPSQIERLEKAILEPLAEIMDDLFPEADRAAGALRAAAENGDPPAELSAAATVAADAADRLADAMAAVLTEMTDLAEFHEAVRDLQRLVDRQEDLLDRTRDEQKRDLIDGLFE